MTHPLLEIWIRRCVYNILEEMRSLKRYLVVCSAAALLAVGCATTYRPVIDPLSAPDSAALEDDLADCEQIARSSVDDPGAAAMKSGTTSAIRGAALGAVLGVIAGAITGSVGTGAAVGAATGGAAGAARGAITGGTSAQSQYEATYDICMLNRGYELLNTYPPESGASNPE